MKRLVRFLNFLAIVVMVTDIYGMEIVSRCSTRGAACKIVPGKSSAAFLVAAGGTGGITKFDPYTGDNFCDPFSGNRQNTHFPTRGTAYDALIVGEPMFIDPVLFVADGDSGLTILTGDTGTDWVVTKRFALPGITRSLALYNNSIVAAGDSGLFIFSLPCSTGNRCSLLVDSIKLTFSETTYCRHAEDVSVASPYAYVITEYGTIVSCNLTKPEKVTYVLMNARDTCALAVKNGIAYTVTSGLFSGFEVLFEYPDTDPPQTGYRTPLFEKSLFGGHGEDIVIFGNYAYMAVSTTASRQLFNGCIVYDIADPYNPRFVDSCSTPGTAYGIFVDTASIYIADGDSGIVVIANDLPVTETVVQPGPDRVTDRSGHLLNNGAEVAFSAVTGSNGQVRVRIVSVDGKVCRTLLTTGCLAGRHMVTWDFTDTRGRAVAPGIYFAMMETAGKATIFSIVKP